MKKGCREREREREIEREREHIVRLNILSFSQLSGPGNEGTGLLLAYFATQVALSVWSVWNFSKMRYMRVMLRPQVRAD